MAGNTQRNHSTFSKRGWLRAFFAKEARPSTETRLLLEPLEARQVMAGDVDFSVPTTADSSQWESPAADFAQSSGLDRQAEGEAAPDLVAFAKSLSDAGVKFFGAIWCKFCNEQKALFQDGGDYLPFVEVTNPNRTLNAVGTAENITTYPTWEFQDGSRVTGVLSLAEISQESGIPIPSTNTPSFVQLGSQTVLIGSPLMVPINAYNPDGTPLTISVSSSNPNLLQASVLQGNRSITMNVRDWGAMTFELFEGLAPLPTSRIIQLAQSGFYNNTANNQIIFHRVIDDFVLQAGDPTGTGSGGSTLGDIDDQFHLDLQHNRTGLLSYAKSGDDTNDSQFFITEGPQRHLDFNHSIFGVLVEGDSVREGISETPVTSSRPNTPVVIDTVNVFNDAENGVIMLKAVGNQTGTANITITVTNQDGRSVTQVVPVTIAADTVNTAPFLDPVTTPAAVAQGQPIQIQLSSKDAEGDAVTYFARKVGNVDYTTSVNQSTRTVTVTPPANHSGPLQVIVGVNQPTGTTFSGAEDTQLLTLTVASGAPTGVDLVASSDTGVSNSDNITNAASLQFTVSGVTAGATVRLKSGTTQLGEAVVAAGQTSVTITTTQLASLGNGTRSITATQVVGGTESGASPALEVTLDTAPPAQITSDVATTAIVGKEYLQDLRHPDEGTGFQYALQGSPAGMTVDATSGVVRWTPISSQTGNQTYTVRYSDAAGNTSTQTFNVAVAASSLVGVRLEATNLTGTPITTVASGQEFLLRVLVQDETGISAQGIFSAYMDLLYDSQLLATSGASPVTFTSFFSTSRSPGTLSAGLIDEFGAAGGSTPPGGDEQLLATIRLRALRPGQAVISTNRAESAGTDFAAYQFVPNPQQPTNLAIPADRISFGSALLSITAGFTAANDVFNMDEDGTNFSMNVLANDQPTAGSTLTIRRIGQAPTNGTVTIATDGQTLRYTPNANFNGTDLLTYVVGDQGGAEQTATVTVQVQPVNDPPRATNDTFSAARNSSGNVLDVLLNDLTTPDTGETLRVTALGTTSSGGTVSISSSGGNVLYTPPANFDGTDTFTYTISDRLTGGLTATGTVAVTVGTVNAPPTPVNDAFTVVEDAAAANFNLVGNDTNSDTSETMTISAIGAPNNGGTATLLTDGTGVRYQPRANFFGTETLTYTLRDSGGGTATGTVVFTVTAVNDPPTAVIDTARLAKGGGAQTINVLTNDSSAPDGTETLTITAVGTTSNGGTVTINTARTAVIYTPPSATFVGNDSFTYTISDPAGATVTATVNVEVVDYVPRDFNLQVAGTTGFRIGAPIRLTGTDHLGTPVSTTFSANGSSFSLADQAPGTYTASLDPLPFLMSSNSQTIELNSELDDGDATLTLPAPKVVPAAIGIEDFLNSTRYGVWAAVRPGQTSMWLQEFANNLGGITSPSVQLSSDGTQVTLTALRDGNPVTATLTVNGSDGLVRRTLTQGNDVLLKIVTSTSRVNYQAVTSAASASSVTPQGEGEPDIDAALSLNSANARQGTAGNAFATNPSSTSAAINSSGLRSRLLASSSQQNGQTTPSTQGDLPQLPAPQDEEESATEPQFEAVDSVFELLG